MSNETWQEPRQGPGFGPGSRITQFRSGVSGNPMGERTRRLKLQHKIAEFAAPYGGVAALGPDELELVRQAALLTIRRVSDAEQQVRVANALRSIFELLAERHRKPRPIPSVAEGTESDVIAAALRQLRQGSDKAD